MRLKLLVYRCYAFLNSLSPTWRIGEQISRQQYAHIAIIEGVISTLLNIACLVYALQWPQANQLFISLFFVLFLCSLTGTMLLLTNVGKISSDQTYTISGLIFLTTPARWIIELSLDVLRFTVQSLWLVMRPYKRETEVLRNLVRLAKCQEPALKGDIAYVAKQLSQIIDEKASYFLQNGYMADPEQAETLEQLFKEKMDIWRTLRRSSGK